MKQKISKKLFLPIVIVVLSLAYSSAQNYLPVWTLSSVNSCATQGRMYLNEDNDADGLPDYFVYLRSNFRYTLNNPPSRNVCQIMQYTDPTNVDNTKIYYYAQQANMLQKLQGVVFGPLDNVTFKRMAQSFHYNQRVRGIDSNDVKIIFERPMNLTWANTTVSIIYDYKYRVAGWYANGNKTWRYNPVASWLDYHGLLPTEIVYWNDIDRVWWSVMDLPVCKNYMLSRCGDGTKDTYNSTWINQFSGEVCDDGPLNGTPGYCNVTCSGTWGWAERCGDNIIQPAGTNYNGDVNTPSFEECDDGDLTGDNGDGILNGDDPATHFCSSICLPTFSEAFTEEFVNG